MIQEASEAELREKASQAFDFWLYLWQFIAVFF